MSPLANEEYMETQIRKTEAAIAAFLEKAKIPEPFLYLRHLGSSAWAVSMPCSSPYGDKTPPADLDLLKGYGIYNLQTDYLKAIRKYVKKTLTIQQAYYHWMRQWGRGIYINEHVYFPTSYGIGQVVYLPPEYKEPFRVTHLLLGYCG